MKTATATITSALRRLTRSPRLVFALLAALAANSSWAVSANVVSWAVSANVVWESDFGTASKTGLDGKTYTLTLPDNSWLQQDGTIKIGSDDNSQGATISVTGGVSGEKVTVIYEYQNASAQSAAVPIYVDVGAWLGLQTKDSSLDVVGHWWNGGGVIYPNVENPPTITQMPENGYLMFVFAQGSNVEVYSGSTLAGLTGGEISGLNTANRVVSRIALGGVMSGANGATLSNRPVSEFTGLVIKRVAIFTSQISASEAASYKFPSDVSEIRATVSTPDTPWSDVFPSWDDNADNSTKVVYLDIQEGASVTKDTALNIYGLSVSGAGALSLSGAVTTPYGIVIGSGATVTLSGGTSSTIANNGTLNVNDCTVSGAIASGSNSTLNFTDCNINGGISAPQNDNVTVNTYGTVVFGSSANNSFEYSTTFNVMNGTTTYNSSSGKKLWCNIDVKSGATLINQRADGFNYDANASYPIHAHIRGTLTMNAKWTIGAGNYIHLYNGAVIDGSGHLHFNTGTGKVVVEEDGNYTIDAPFNTDNGSAKVEVKGAAILTLSNMPNNLKIEKAGTGTLKWANKVLRALSGSGGTIEIDASSGNLGHTFISSEFDGVLKLTGSKQNNLLGSGTSKCFADSVRPELIANAFETYLSKDAYNGQTLYVRNLSGSNTGAKLDARYTTGPISYTLDTLQERDTEYLGIFNNNSEDTRAFALNVTGNNIGGIHTLTLAGNNASTDKLTVSNYAKVRFTSSGKWSKGIVEVGANGVLESQNSSAIAATLAVKKGATLKFADGVALAATAYDWSDVSGTLEAGEEIKIDLSDVTLSGTPVTLIASGVTATAEKFTVSATKDNSSATLFVVDGALKATSATGNICVNGTWISEPVADQSATIILTQNSTLNVATDLSLGVVTVEKDAAGAASLTITGAGALSTPGFVIPADVTVYSPASLTVTTGMAGDGTLEIPVGATANMTGACTAKVVVKGTLNTTGAASFLNTNNTIESGGLLDVVSGTTLFTTPGTDSVHGIAGDLTVRKDAVFTIKGGSFNHVLHSGTSTLDISGTVNMGDKQWQFSTGITINLREGAVINGNGESTYGDWGFIVGANTVNVYGNTTIAASIYPYNTTFDIAQNATLTISGSVVGDSASLLKSGLGTLDITANALSKSLTINGGKVVAATVPTANVTINESGTFTLQNGSWTGTADVFSGAGTLELVANTSDFSQYHATSTFAGKIKFFGNSSKMPYFNGTPPQFTNKPAFELSGWMTLASNFNGSENKFTVRNLVGASECGFDANYDTGVTNPRYVSTLQTADTEFAGNFSDGSYSRKTALYVYGENQTVHSLTLSAENTTTGPLEIGAYGKVVFASAGKWQKGLVTVGENGYLESNNSSAIKQLKLIGGATIVFPTSASSLTGITSMEFASGTTTVTFPNGVPENGGTLIDWSGASLAVAPAGTFAFGDASLAEVWGLYKDANGLTIYPKSIDDDATLSVDGTGALVADVAAGASDVALPSAVTKLTVSVGAAALPSITAPGVDAANVVVKYGATETTGAYAVTKTNGVIAFDINTAADAAVGGVKVKPEIASGTTVANTGAPTLAFATIPGLWYAVETSTDGSTFTAGTAKQATGASITLTADAPATVKYYRIKVSANNE